MRALRHTLAVAISISIAAILASSVQAEIHIKKDKVGRITVPVKIGDGEIRYFLLDTAARRFGIRQDNIPDPLIQTYSERNIRHMSSSGLLVLPLAKIKRIEFGKSTTETAITGLFPAARGDGDIAGVVGFDAYQGYILHVQPRKLHLELHANAGEFANAGWRLIPGHPNAYGGLLIENNYDGQDITVLLASGLSKTLINRAAAVLLYPELFPKGKRKNPTQFGHSVVLKGLHSSLTGLDTLVLEDFHVLGWELGDLEVGISVLPVREQTGFIGAPFIMLGSDVLASREYALDARNHQLWVPREAP